MFTVKRSPHNPIIQSDNDHPWRSLATFNCSPAKVDGQLHLLYRAMSDESLYEGHHIELSTIGHTVAESEDGAKLGEHKQLIIPEKEWELYGCEDPRVTQIDDNYYIFYTAISDFPFKAEGIRSAVAITKDFKTIEEKHLVTPFNSKAMALFPEKVNDKWTVILTANSDLPPSKMAIAQVDALDELWSHSFWNEWYEEVDKHNIDLRRVETDHCEVGAPPIKTEQGWLLIYSHIQNYFTDEKIFGIEAVLLDEENPRKVIGRTRYPFMVPEESYEQYGQLADIVFPSGATLEGDELTIFYGATDTTCCMTTLSYEGLVKHMTMDGKSYVERYSGDPILTPRAENEWESRYVFNPTALEIDNTTHILYRAFTPENTSVIGYANSKDGFTIDERLDQPIYTPRADFEKKKNKKDDYSGCEDARAVIIDDRIYITYTGYNGADPPAVAASSISVTDFLKRRWNKWDTPELISPPGIDDKDAAIFPEKIGNKYMILHRIEHHVCADFVDKLNFKKHKLTRCIQIFGPRQGMWDSKKVGINGPPIKTDDGWLLFYHGINDHDHYCMGAVLLDLDDPTVILARTAVPIMEPEEDWECDGWIPNVVFSCGQVVRDDTIYIYYGGADKVVGVATLSLSETLASLAN